MRVAELTNSYILPASERGAILTDTLLAITVDTEEEWDWNGPFPRPPFSTRNADRLGKFQSFCDRLGLKPTWLVDYAIADDPASVRHLREASEDGRCEIGAHLHPWATPPVEEAVNERNSHILNLPHDLVARKLETLTKKLEKAFGRRPVSFRAGRWGLDGRLLRLLRDQGYTVDTSVHPYFSDTAFSYEGAPDEPYWPDFDSLLERGSQRDILELPATSGFNVSGFEGASRLHRLLSRPPLGALRMVGVLWHTRLLRKITLSPELFDARDMLALARASIRRGRRFLNLYFHSSSLLPGCTPYVPDEAAEERFYGYIESFRESLKSLGNVQPVTLAEAGAQLKAGT
jgi:hypothetical protein